MSRRGVTISPPSPSQSVSGPDGRAAPRDERVIRFRLPLPALAAIVALRLAIGWHFYQEGAAKLRGAPVASGNVFLAAKGPLASWYRGTVWDPYGRYRLDRRSTERLWAQYIQSTADAFRLSENDRKALKAVERAHRRKLREFFDSIASDLEEYWVHLDRLLAYQNDPMRQEVASLREQVETIEHSRVLQKVRPWLEEVDRLWAAFEEDVRRVMMERVQKAPGPLPRPGRRWWDSETIDRIVPYFDTAVGVCLLVGIFTPLAAWAGAAFLALIVISQFPGTPGAVPTYYQVVECLALVVLATVRAGRFAGLDAVVCGYRARRAASARNPSS